MKRWVIISKTGIEFRPTGEVLNPQPEWGEGYTIVSEQNIDAELANLARLAEEKKQAKERLKSLDLSTINGVADVRVVLKDIIIALKLGS